MADVQAAWIAAGASAIGVIVSFGTAIYTLYRNGAQQKALEAFKSSNAEQLEILKSRLSTESDVASSKRDYEYDARKRLYSELYPLTFQLNQAATYARKRIRNLALATRTGALATGPDNWITSPDSYYFNNVMYAVLAPLAVIEVMTRRLTMLDLTLDENLRRQYFLGCAAFEALRSDFNLVSKPYPPLEMAPDHPMYKPPEVAPQSMQPLDERWQWRQGLYSGQISQALNCLITNAGDVARVITFAEFAALIGNADLRDPQSHAGSCTEPQKSLSPLIALFRNFHPARRPVTWRILLAQATCYRAIEVASSRETVLDQQLVQGSQYESTEDYQAFAWLGDPSAIPQEIIGAKIDFATEQSAAFKSANLYIANVVKEFHKSAAA